MNPDATWAIITDVDSTPEMRREAALNLLVWYARAGNDFSTHGELLRINACERVILAEFEYADRLAGR